MPVRWKRTACRPTHRASRHVLPLPPTLTAVLFLSSSPDQPQLRVGEGSSKVRVLREQVGSAGGSDARSVLAGKVVATRGPRRRADEKPGSRQRKVASCVRALVLVLVRGRRCTGSRCTQAEAALRTPSVRTCLAVRLRAGKPVPMGQLEAEFSLVEVCKMCSSTLSACSSAGVLHRQQM